MKMTFSRLNWLLPVLALLAGCNGGNPEKPKTHAIATYTSATDRKSVV